MFYLQDAGAVSDMLTKGAGDLSGNRGTFSKGCMGVEALVIKTQRDWLMI